MTKTYVAQHFDTDTGNCQRRWMVPHSHVLGVSRPAAELGPSLFLRALVTTSRRAILVNKRLIIYNVTHVSR